MWFYQFFDYCFNYPAFYWFQTGSRKMLVIGFAKGKKEVQYEIRAHIKIVVWINCLRNVIECEKICIVDKQWYACKRPQ